MIYSPNFVSNEGKLRFPPNVVLAHETSPYLREAAASLDISIDRVHLLSRLIRSFFKLFLDSEVTSQAVGVKAWQGVMDWPHILTCTHIIQVIYWVLGR